MNGWEQDQQALDRRRSDSVRTGRPIEGLPLVTCLAWGSQHFFEATLLEIGRTVSPGIQMPMPLLFCVCGVLFRPQLSFRGSWTPAEEIRRLWNSLNCVERWEHARQDQESILREAVPHHLLAHDRLP